MRGLALGIDVQFRAVVPFLVEENQRGRAVCATSKSLMGAPVFGSSSPGCPTSLLGWQTDYGTAVDGYPIAPWLASLFLGEGPEADRLRERALPLLAAEPERVPDHSFSGLDLPSDENVRRVSSANYSAGIPLVSYPSSEFRALRVQTSDPSTLPTSAHRDSHTRSPPGLCPGA
jgi:hypothetical protein